MAIQIYNTLASLKEPFVPLTPGEVKMYVCGPTVYNLVHIGNMRGPIFFNAVRNFLKKKGFKVTYVYNYTDVDDRIIETANKERVDSKVISERYIREFEKDYARLGLDPHDVNPKVTEHIPEIIETIEKIIEHGAGYVTDDGEVLCSIEKIKGYGKLSHKNIDELIAGARVEIGAKKKNPLDFTLWKPAKPGEPKWPSPWGDGRPGWHIECSAMASKYLGETFDIHGGGIDLIFPHHENEIAQSESANQKPFVRYWMHNNFINMGKEKMSKSLGNITLARVFLDQFNAEILKYWFLQSHYRSPVEMTEATIHHAIQGLARIYSALAQAYIWKSRCEKAGLATLGGVDMPFRLETQRKLAAANKQYSQFVECVTSLPGRVDKAFEDDFNTPEVISAVFDAVRAFNAILKPGLRPSAELLTASLLFIANIQDIGALMSLFLEEPRSFLVSLDDMLLAKKGVSRDSVQKKVDERSEARLKKDFQKSDQIRGELAQLDILVRDGPDGTEWEVKK